MHLTVNQMTQALAYKGILEMTKPPKRRRTESMLDLTRYAVEELVKYHQTATFGNPSEVQPFPEDCETSSGEACMMRTKVVHSSTECRSQNSKLEEIVRTVAPSKAWMISLLTANI